MSLHDWNIKIICEEGKKLDINVYHNGTFKVNNATPPQDQKLFIEGELETLRNMTSEMDTVRYVKMECTRL